VNTPRKTLMVLVILALVFFINLSVVQATDTVERSYHGQLGKSPALGGWGNGLGMLEKWCAIPNFSFEKQGRIKGWKEKCGKCHTSTYRDPTTGKTDCTLCHETKDGKGKPTIAQCNKCHVKDCEKRGDVFDEEHSIHIEMGMRCQDCHVRLSDEHSDHQFAKGYAIDTTEDTMEGTLSCTTCHEEKPHGNVDDGVFLDKHVMKISCETCHTGRRPGKALKSKNWNKFTKEGNPVTTYREPGWIPTHKWYGRQMKGHLPVIGATEFISKIYPFNEIEVSWFIVSSGAALDDVIIVPEVKAADSNKDGEVTVEEMRKYEGGKYKDATLVTKKFSFNVTHSIQQGKAFKCNDCHGANAYVLNWEELGYDADPYK
jgi:methanogenesis multiheme c-type cytochrome